MTLDDLFKKTYNENTYNCAHFVVDAWFTVTGEDISQKMESFLYPLTNRGAPLSLVHRFELLAKPISPCIVLMRDNTATPHVGLYYNSRVLHLNEAGVQNTPLEVASFGYNRIRFYR